MSKKKIAIIVFAILVIIGVVVFFLLRGRISATTMRILRLEGSVSLQEDGALKTVKENLRLVSGNVLDTSDESLVSIGLDEAKIVTLDELSRAEFNQSGKYLSLDLTKGSLFFEVDKPLAEDETFEIETSTMIVGIRGTSGWVSVDGENESLIITDGHVHVVGTNPVTGEVKEVEVNAGQRLIVYLYNDREVDSIMFELEDITEHELSKFVINILRNKASLLDKVIAATGWDRDYILGISDADPEPDPDDDPNTPQVADADPEPDPEPEPEPEPDPVIPDVGGNDDPNPAQDNNGNNNPGNNNNNNNNNNIGVTTADTLVTAPVTRTELEKQIDAARAQISTNNADGTYILADGTLFDPVYYGQTYPDVVAQYGNTSEALLAHYVATGQDEGRYASRPEQDAAELAEDIARLEAQRVADEANAVNNNNTTNQQAPAQQQQQQQQPQQQQQNQNTNRVVNGNVTLTNGASATYANGTLTITGADTNSNGVATLPANITDENGQQVNVDLRSVTVDPNSNVGTLDISQINAPVGNIYSFFQDPNMSTVSLVSSPVTYTQSVAITPAGTTSGTYSVHTDITAGSTANLDAFKDEIVKMYRNYTQITSLTYGNANVYVALNAKGTPAYYFTIGQTTYSDYSYDSNASSPTTAVFTSVNAQNPTITVNADGSITTTP